MSTRTVKIQPELEKDHVIGYAVVRAFEHQWKGSFDTRPVTVEGRLAVLHVATDGAYLVRARGGYRLWVNPDQVVRFEDRV